MQQTASNALSPLGNADEDYLTRVLNTAFISSKADSNSMSLNELMEVSRTPAFRVLLSSIHKLSSDLGCSESEAAEQMINVFKRLDKIWGQYITAQGIEKLKALAPKT